MGTSYYWKSNKYKIAIYIGRNLSPEDMDLEGIREVVRTSMMYDDSFGDDLYTALKEKEIARFSLDNVATILKAAKLYSTLCLSERASLEVYILNKLLGGGCIINDGNDKFEKQTKGYRLLEE